MTIPFRVIEDENDPCMVPNTPNYEGKKSLGGTKFQDYAYRRLMKSTNSNGVQNDMKVDDFPLEFPKYCAILTNVPLDKDFVMKRVDDTQPYSEANLIFISRRAFNGMKSGLTLSELKLYVQYLEENLPSNWTRATPDYNSI